MSEYKLKLRPYQKAAVDKISGQNAIVKMPTGSGKTFVAAEFMRRGLANTPTKIDDDTTVLTMLTTGSDSVCTKNSSIRDGLSALFLVPTCDLAVQQRRAVQAWVGGSYEVVEYMGGKAAPTKRFDVLVSTPQAFLVSCAIINY
jgi:superfamily II DNA or RNA helicase